MTNKIEFRAWDESQKYMAYQGTPDLENIQSFMLHFGDKPLMQYIGINDIKGNKIYNKDILKVGENLTCEITYIGENNTDYGDEIHAAYHAVVYGRDTTIPIDTFFLENCVVIGNTFENPY